MRARGSARFAVLVVAALVCCASTCSSAGKTDHDFDDGKNDNDGDEDSTSSSLAERAPAGWELRDFELVSADEPGIRRDRTLQRIRGLALSRQLGANRDALVDYEIFASRVVDANPGLLGLPADAGVLRSRGVERTSDGVFVTFAQERIDEQGNATMLPDAALRFRFDGDGSLCEIQDTLVIEP